MGKYKVALTQALSEPGMKYLQQFADPYVINSSDADVLLKALPGMDALISRGGRLNRSFFEQAAKTGLKVLGKTSAGVDTVDLDGATEFGIPVVFAPGANARSVAEYALASILAVNKKIVWSNREMHRGHREYRDSYLASQFKDKQILLLGFGNIGRQLAAMCTSLSIHVTVYDKYVTKEAVEMAGCQYVEDFHEVLGEMDFISVHVPLTESTYGILSAAEIDLMKPSAYIINTSRGGIVNEKDLVDRISSGRLAGAFFDVVEGEPDISNSPLVNCDKVILSGHIAGQTEEALFATARDCVDGVIDVLNGNRWGKVANPQVYESDAWKAGEGR